MLNSVAMVEALNPIPSQCPVCSRALYVERVRCAKCATAVEGRFSLEWPARLSREQLNFVRFPLGDKSKSETRALARRFGLPVAEKQDSQDICFVPSGRYSEVIERLKPGADPVRR